ncbi:MAG: type II secretion system protein [Nitrosomonadales bacterium]|nr:type II secretion system protein [Nitrosomonadales bacterium]
MRSQSGFTLVEMVLVITITGILGSMVAVFLRAPVQGYVDSARRAELTDIADTALQRMTRDLRQSLSNSLRVTGACNGTGACYLEFLPAKGGGRYRTEAPGDVLDFTLADTSFEVLGPLPAIAAGDSVVIYNLGIAGASAYANDNRAAYTSQAGSTLTVASKLFPFDSPGNRFQVINTPVTYLCDPANGTLRRYWGYAIQAAQPSSTAAAPLATASNALLASNVSSCTFTYDTTSQRIGLVTLRLTVTESGESVTLYNAVHVNNIP